MTDDVMTLGQAAERLFRSLQIGTDRTLKRVPYDMVDEYTPDGWVVVERHATYVTMEKIGG